MFCRQCGRKAENDRQKFCKACGYQFPQKTKEVSVNEDIITVKCPECSYDNNISFRFCNQCGYEINQVKEKREETQEPSLEEQIITPNSVKTDKTIDSPSQTRDLGSDIPSIGDQASPVLPEVQDEVDIPSAGDQASPVVPKVQDDADISLIGEQAPPVGAEVQDEVDISLVGDQTDPVAAEVQDEADIPSIGDQAPPVATELQDETDNSSENLGQQSDDQIIEPQDDLQDNVTSPLPQQLSELSNSIREEVKDQVEKIHGELYTTNFMIGIDRTAPSKMYELAKQAFELDPNYFSTVNAMAQAAMGVGDLQTAYEMNSRLLNEYPEMVMIKLRMAQIFEEFEQYDQALNHIIDIPEMGQATLSTEKTLDKDLVLQKSFLLAKVLLYTDALDLLDTYKEDLSCDIRYYMNKVLSEQGLQQLENAIDTCTVGIQVVEEKEKPSNNEKSLHKILKLFQVILLERKGKSQTVNTSSELIKKTLEQMYFDDTNSENEKMIVYAIQYVIHKKLGEDITKYSNELGLEIMSQESFDSLHHAAKFLLKQNFPDYTLELLDFYKQHIKEVQHSIYYQDVMRTALSPFDLQIDFAKTYEALKDFVAAGSIYEELYKTDPELEGLLNQAVRMYDWGEAHENTILLIDSALDKIPQKHQEEYSLRKAKALFNLDRFEEAEEIFLHYKKPDEDRLEMLIHLGKLASRKYNIEEARNYYEKAFSIDPHHIDVKYSYFHILHTYRDEKLIQKIADKLLEENPDDHYILATKGLSLVRQSNYKDPSGISLIKQAISTFPNDPEYMTNLGFIYLEMDDLDKAEKQFDSALQVHAEWSDAWMGKAMVEEAREDYEVAISYIKQDLNLRPNNITGYIKLAELYMQLENYNDALESCAKGLSHMPLQPDLLSIKAQALFLSDKRDDALMEIDVLINQDPSDDKAYYVKSNFYIQMENYEKALETIDKGMELNPDEIHFWYSKGRTLLALDREDEARVLLLEAESKFPVSKEIADLKERLG